MMDMDLLRRLIKLVEDSDIDTLEVSRFGRSVKISKSPTGAAVTTAVTRASSAEDDAGSAPRAESGGVASPGSTDDGLDGLHEVASPMVGTFYRAPAPDAPPYVEVGDRVAKGQTLCILEAMKLMNELEAEVAGVVREVSVQNAEPVEFGQPLFRIELDGAG